MLKKMLIIVLSASLHASIFSAASSSRDTSKSLMPINASAPAEPSKVELIVKGSAIMGFDNDDDWARAIEHDEKKVKEFTAKVGSTKNGKWIFTEERIADDGQRYYEDEIYEKTDSGRKIIRQQRDADGKAKVVSSSRTPLAPSESKRYCFSNKFTPEGNQLLQLLVDRKCLTLFLKKDLPVHRFRHLSREQAIKECVLVRGKIELLQSQFTGGSYNEVYKKACSLTRKEFFRSAFLAGYVLGTPPTTAQRPRSWSA